MRLQIFFLLSIIVTNSLAEKSAIDLVIDIYRTCANDLSINCAKPKALSWIINSAKKDEIKITNDMKIIRVSRDVPIKFDQQKRSEEIEFFDMIDNFITTHALIVKAPSLLKTKEARSLIPAAYLKRSLTEDFQVPLADGNAVEGRGFVKKVMIPFLLGLKFKTTVLVPLALALIALKTWKAMTLGLLSLVLSGALVIFKIAKPKIVNYEVVHYPHHHVEHHVDHVVPHHLDHVVPHHLDHIVPHHLDHIVPHHIEHVVPHHVDHVVPHHIEHVVPHHVDHISHNHLDHHLEHIVPHNQEHFDSGWEPHSWARSSDVTSSSNTGDAQELAYKNQIVK